MKDAYLLQKHAKGVLEKALTELEACRSRLLVTKQGVITGDTYGILITRTYVILREHVHTQTTSKECSIVEAIKIFLETQDRYRQ